jgi:hypothetical protein
MLLVPVHTATLLPAAAQSTSPVQPSLMKPPLHLRHKAQDRHKAPGGHDDNDTDILFDIL